MFRTLRSVWIIPFLLAVALFTAGVWTVAWRGALDQLADRAQSDLALASDRLTRHLFRYRELAVILAEHPDLLALLRGQGSPSEARALLLSMADKTGAIGVELVDHMGQVVATSRDDAPPRDRAALPLRRALNGALGVTNAAQVAPSGLTRRLFTFAAPVFANGGPARGAVVVEVDIWLFEQNWPTTASAVYFFDRKGRVFVSNRSELVLVDRFSDEGFVPYTARRTGGHDIWSVDGGPYLPARALHLLRDFPVIGMTAEILLDTAPAMRTAVLQAAVAAALCLVFGAFLALATLRRRTLAEANARLEARVAKRTQALSAANADLTREVGERTAAEAALRKAQADLVQAGKLSALGQMSAGISHELNQPLMAIRSFAENGTQFLERGRPDTAAQNLTRISELARRMGRIIKNLRAFARQESEPISDVDMGQVVDAALEMATGKLAGITVDWLRPSLPVRARGGEVRLQQVAMNLIGNAADAMEDAPERRLEITLRDGPRVLLSVRDTGPGIADPDRIFEPFYTTKQVGAAEGMGLGLSISYGLVQSFGGVIRGANHPDGGAVFTVDLDPSLREVAA